MDLKMFTKNFSSYAIVGETISCEADGFVATATIVEDNQTQPVDHFSQEEKTRWRNSEWSFCGLMLSVRFNGILINDKTMLFGIELNLDKYNNHLLISANDLLQEAIAGAKQDMKELVQKFQELQQPPALAVQNHSEERRVRREPLKNWRELFQTELFTGTGEPTQ